MKPWSIVAVFALLGFVAYGHPHPRRIERSVVGVQNPDLLKLGVLDAGQIHSHEADIDVLRVNTAIIGIGDAGFASVDTLEVTNWAEIELWCFDGFQDCNASMQPGGYGTLTSGVTFFFQETSGMTVQGKSGGQAVTQIVFQSDGGTGNDTRQWAGMDFKAGTGLNFQSGAGMYMKPGSALDVRGSSAFVDAGFGGNISVAGTSTLNYVDAGVVYFGNLASPTEDFVLGTWGGGDGAGPAAEDQNMGPAHETGAFPAKIGNVGFMWASAGTGGTNGVQAVVYEYPSGPALCSCFVGPCTAPAKSWSKCACGTRMGANKTYVVRVGGGTDCAANPSDITFGAQLLR